MIVTTPRIIRISSLLLALALFTAGACKRREAQPNEDEKRAVAVAEPVEAAPPIDPPGASPEEQIVTWLQANAEALDDHRLDSVAAKAAERRIVLLGESTHGTREYYELRAELSKRLLTDHGFRFVAVEGDWDAISRLNRRAQGDDERNSREIMASFERWPRWMWANEEMVEFVEWMREFNAHRAPKKRVHLYGADIYGAADSAARVSEFLERDHAETWPCLADWLDDRPGYMRAFARGEIDCRDEAAERAAELAARLEAAGGDDHAIMNAWMNARVVEAAERNFRAATTRGPGNWNTRATFFADVVAAMLEYHGEESKAVFWAHNTHIGDSAATPMAGRGQVNIGHRIRADFGAEAVFGIGFGTYEGDVLAGSRWGGPMEFMRLPPSPAGTWEALMNEVEHDRFHILLDHEETPAVVNETRGHRAVGVVYDPQNEQGNYVPSRLRERYNAFIFVRTTKALRPID